jgi:son of sevenless-like protein
LDSASEKSYLEITHLTNNAKNYATLRFAIADINPPVIPYLGMYLTDILFAIEGNGPYINGLINFFR